MDNKDQLLAFLKSQQLLVVGTLAEEQWITNVFYGIDDDFKIYFVSDSERTHSQHILQNPIVTFSTVWFDPANHEDRKGVQGRGVCRKAENTKDIENGVSLHNKLFPEFKARITPDYISSAENKSHIWIIEPKLIKFWDDELYKDKQWEEFIFN